MKGGLGTPSLRLGEVVIGALAVVNAAGDIVDWRTGKTLAGARRADGKGFANLIETLKQRLANLPPHASLRLDDQPLHSTTLVVLATNVRFNKTQLTKIAMMANCGAARAIDPYHTTGDGDQLYAISTSVLSRLGFSNGPGGGADIDFDVCATLAVCAVVKNYVGHHTSRLRADVPLSAVGALAAQVVAEAIGRGVKAASSIEGWLAYCDFTSNL